MSEKNQGFCPCGCFRPKKLISHWMIITLVIKGISRGLQAATLHMFIVM